MVGYWTKERKNFASLIIGIILILLGLTGVSLTLPFSQPIILVPALILIIGVILAIIGGLRKWR